MPTPVAAARQCLSPAAVPALDAAVASARRRAHAQTTSLHLISSLLAPPAPPLLRDALARARSAAYSPRVQLKALDLCFAVSLDRLPSVSASSSSGAADEPPVSNSLMAAIKRSQANQRRNPDTFHFYHQAATAQTPAAVKVELSHLVLAILDDPIVSRVFAEAGFRSGDIKLAILRPAPPMPLLGRLPTRTRPPPLFLCSFAAADDADVPSPAGNLAGAGEENCRRIAEILSRGRNPMLVGVGAASAADDFAAASPYRIIHVDPNTIDRSDLGVAAAMASATSGLIISIGDLKQLVPDEDAEAQEKGRRVVAEVTRVLETLSKVGRVWVMGWSATYETYLAFLSKFPLVDKDWDLQLLPITAVHAAATAGPAAAAAGLMPPATTVAAFSKPAASLMDSFVPFGGFLCDNYEENSLTANSCPQALRCQQCNDKYEQEVATIISAGGITAEDHHQGGLPSLLQNGSMMGPNNGFDPVKARDDQMVLNSKILNLRKKWNEYCLRLHQDHQRINRDPYKPFPRYIGVPTDKERSANSSKGSESVGVQKDVIKPCAVSAVHSSSTARPISSPSVTNKRNEDLVLNLQARHSKSDENLQERGMQSQHGTLSNVDNPDDHVSPSSAAPVETDLVLGTPRECSSKGSSSTCSKRVEDSERSVHLVPKKVDDLNLKHPQLSVQPNSCSWSSINVGKTSHSTLHSASGGFSAFGQWQKRSPLAAQNSDLSNYKLLVERLFKVVGRQEEALSAICESIVRCRSTESRRGPNRNDIWLCFHGSDSMAKKRIAMALAELMHGSKENLIYLDLNLQDWDDSSFRGKTGIDCIVEQLSKKRQSVLFLDNIDRADCLVQDSLSDAIKSGRFQDMRGKVVDINDSIVVLSRSMIQGSKNGLEEGLSFSEEKILATRGHRLKILVEPGRAITSGCPSGKVVVSPRHFLTKIQASLCSGSISKRKLSISDDQEKLQESPSSSKRLHRTSSVPFDLNLPVDEDEPLDADDDSSSHENSYGNTEKSIDALLHSVDGSINFKPFDFDKLADDMLQEFSNILRKNLGSECMLEIDVGAMEQILAAAWKSEDRKPVPTWLEQVFARSLDELKLKCKHVSSSTLRLVACEDTVPTVKGDGLGVLLPPRIILDC
ncbi:protein DWARF 53 [Oryza glaberrima]|uniref:Clp R domain-containing protein n=1 Tax=Oryza glaberrima TaxID=4538 RepID=I1QX00_ORYGL|nr:protein DWARF 53 [Oryza glaberrima]